MRCPTRPFLGEKEAVYGRRRMVGGWGLLGFWRFVIGE